MSNETQIDVALANLEAGRFSFRTNHAIKSHIERLERELETLQGLHADAVRDLKTRDYDVWRLEAELTKSNARVYALLKANRLTEQTCRLAGAVGARGKTYAEAFATEGAACVSRLVAELKNRELQDAARRLAERLLDRARHDLDAVVSRLRQADKPTWDIEQAKKAVAALVASLEAKLPPKLGEHVAAAKEQALSSVQRAASYLSARTQ